MGQRGKKASIYAPDISRTQVRLAQKRERLKAAWKIIEETEDEIAELDRRLIMLKRCRDAEGPRKYRYRWNKETQRVERWR